jgi:hypothetical protein
MEIVDELINALRFERAAADEHPACDDDALPEGPAS